MTDTTRKEPEAVAWLYRIQNISGEWSKWFAEADPEKVERLRSYDYIELEPLYRHPPPSSELIETANHAPTKTWMDRDDDLTCAIEESHPVSSGRHDLYARAFKLVGNRHSKEALVALVNHLLLEAEEARQVRDSYRKEANEMAERAAVAEYRMDLMREALQRIAEAPAWGAPERWETTPAEVRTLAAKTLEAANHLKTDELVKVIKAVKIILSENLDNEEIIKVCRDVLLLVGKGDEQQTTDSSLVDPTNKN